MSISFSETFKKVTSVALIFGIVFSTLTPVAFAATTPIFTASETIANVAVGASSETVTHTVITPNVSEVKATRTIDVQSLPANNSTITVGTCTITFENVGGSTTDELNCNDGNASIDRNTGPGNNPRSASTIAGRIRAITNVGSANHGNLVVSGSGSEAIFTTDNSFTENTASVIGFSGTAAGVSIVSTNSVTSVMPVKQETSITIGGNVDIGDTFTVSSAPLGTASFVATTTSTSDVATGLNAAIQAHPNYPTRNYTTSVSGNVITLTAKTAGVSFTTLTPTTTNFPGTAQVVTFTPANITSGLKFVINLNGTNYTGTTTTGASTVASVAADIVSATVSPGITCVDTASHVTCTANTPGTPFTYSTTIQDVEKPVISLNGSNPVTIQIFGSYNESGATALDNYDGNLTVSNISGTVDTNTVEIYQIHYNITDASGNIADEVVRTVNVVDQENPSTTDNVPAAWQTADTIITFNCTDNVACDKTYYTTDGNDPTLLSSYVDAGTSWQFVVTTEGQYVIKYFSLDAAANPESIKTASNTLKIDKTLPVATAVSIVSNNSNPVYAKEGNTITVSFTTSEPVNTPTATIAGKTATVTNTSGNDYTATYTLTAAETQGVASLAIDFTDIAGNSATQVTATTDSSSVTIDTIKPVLSNIIPNTSNPLVAEFNFTTNENSTAIINYGPSTAYGSTVFISNSYTLNHNITITGLNQCEKYNYSLTITDESGNVYISPDAIFQVNCNVLGGGGGGINAAPFTNSQTVSVTNSFTTPTPQIPNNPTPTQSQNANPNTPTNSPSTSESTPTTPTESTTPENPGTPVDNNNTPTPTPNPTESTPTPEPTPTTPTTGGVTPGGTPAPTFNPADATLDVGGAGNPEAEPAIEEVAPVEGVNDAGGGAAPEENSYTLLWTLLGLIALLNTWWFFVAKNKPQTHRRD